MDGVSSRELIYAAFDLGTNLGRESVVSQLLGLYGLSLNPAMIKRLSCYEDGITLSGYEPFEVITSFKVPDEIIAKLLAGSPRIVIIAQLSQVTEEELLGRYKLTPEQVAIVKQAFEHGDWRLQPSLPPESD
jgi:hypothetical protein